MRTFTANVFVLTAIVGDTTITGTAIDGDTKVNFAVAANDVNQRLFIPEAQLVVAGKFRLAKELATISAWISKIVAVVSIPAPAEVEVEPPAEVEIEPPVEIIDIETSTEVADIEAASLEPVKLTATQKRAATIAAKKAKAELETVSVF